MHSILQVQRISHRCATDTVYRLVTVEEGRVEAQILRRSDQIKLTSGESRSQPQKVETERETLLLVSFVY